MPHLEYTVGAWNSYIKKGCQKLQKAQRNASRISHLLNQLMCEERLNNLGPTTLKARRERGELVQLFKIDKGTYQIICVSPHTRGARRGNRARDVTLADFSQ